MATQEWGGELPLRFDQACLLAFPYLPLLRFFASAFNCRATTTLTN
jgi:hypothetical protein